MSVKSKKKRRRLVVLLAGTLCVAAAGAGAYALRTAQVERRLQAGRAEGMEALRAGDYFTALHKIGAYVQRHPDDPESLYAYAQAREQVEEPDNSHIGQAIRLYLRVLDKQRDNDEARHKLLDLYVRTGFGTEVFPVADALLLHNKNDASALRAKAIASARLGRPDDAVTNAIGYTKAAPDDLDGHLLALDLMFRAKRQPKEVLELTKGWRQAHPDDPRFELLQSVACAGTNDKPGAIEWARRAAGHAPREATLVVALVRQLDLLELFDESSKVLDQATTAAGLPGHNASGPGAAVAAGRGGGGETAVVRRALVARWWQQQRYERVVEYLKDLQPADKGSDSQLLALRAMSLAALGRHDEATRIVDALAGRKGDATASAWATFLPSVVGPKKAEPRHVIEVCRQALEHLPEEPAIQFLAGNAYADVGEREIALEHWGRAFAAAPAWADPLVAMSRTLIAFRRPLEAREAARMASLRAPANVDALSLQAVAWASTVSSAGDAAELLKLVDRVQALKPSEEQTLVVRVAVIARFRDPAQARQALDAALGSATVPSQAALLQLANVSREMKLGAEEQCLARAEKAYGVTAEVAFARAMLLESAGRHDEGFRLFEAANAQHQSQNPRAWKIAWATYLDRVGDARAQKAWTSLGDELPGDMEVQQQALAARSVQSDAAFLERTVGRVRDLSGGQGIRWREAKAQLLLAGHPSDQQVAEAVTLLNEVIKTAPNHLPARLLLGEAQERLGNRTAAIEQFGFALNLDPGSNRIALRLARLSQMQGDFTAAAQYVDRVIKAKSITVEERREAAALLANQGDSERALGLLREGNAKSGEAPADLMLAALYRERNQVKEAEAVYRACLKSPDASAIQEAAGFFASQNRKDEADRVLAMLDAIKLPPGKKEAVRGEHLLRYGDPQQAIGQFEAAVRAAPADPAGWQRLVVTGLVVGKTAEAIDVAGRAIKALPEPDAGPFKTLKQNEQLVSELASTESARLVLPGLVQGPEQSSAAAETLQVIAAAKRNKAGASQFAAELEKVEVRHPNYLPLQILLAQTYMTDQRTGDAAALATRLMQIFPKAVEPAKLAVQALAASGHWNDALDTAKQWRERSLAQPIEADQMIAMAQLAIGQPARAIEQLKPYLTRATADPDANRQLLALYAQARIAAGQPEEAANLLKPLLAKSVPWRDLWVQLAAQAIKDPKLSAAWLNELSSIPGQKSAEDDILLAGGWFVISSKTASPEYAQSARAALETASRTASQEKNLPARRLLALGMLQEGSGNAAAAEATYRRAIQADPNVPEALNNLAMVIVNGNGDLAEAQSFAEKAVKLNPKAAAYQDTLATVHAKQKDFPKAIATMQNAVQLEPGNVKWRIYLGTVLLDAGQPDKAKAVLKEVEDTHPDAERLSESARKRLEILRARVQVDQARSEAESKASISRSN